jgi:recombination protein RecA
LDIRRVGAIKNGEVVVGNRTRVKVVKNKMAPPFREVEFDILYGEGVSKEGDLLVVDKSGSWYSFEGERLGQGREATRDMLKTNRPLLDTIEARVRTHFGLPVNVPPAGAVVLEMPADGAGEAAKKRPRRAEAEA